MPLPLGFCQIVKFIKDTEDNQQFKVPSDIDQDFLNHKNSDEDDKDEQDQDPTANKGSMNLIQKG